jgi:tripartite-type tricarboxylate transporter receptor subunit TctC
MGGMCPSMHQCVIGLGARDIALAVSRGARAVSARERAVECKQCDVLTIKKCGTNQARWHGKSFVERRRNFDMRIITVSLSVLAAVLTLPLAGAQAQNSYPNQPVKIIAANTAGTAVDVLTRIIAHNMTKHFGQQVVVENRPGGGGTIGADAVARSTPDGYTLLVVSPPLQVITPNLRTNLPYDPFKSFIPISLVSTTDNVLIGSPKLPVKDVKGLIELAKKNPGKLKAGNGGTGFQSHLANLMFANAAGIKLLDVAYKGAQFVTGVAAGESDVAIGPLPAVISAVRSNAVVPMAIAADKRSSQLPDTPTMKEVGLDFTSNGWTGIMAPAGTPPQVIAKLSDALTKTLADPETQEQLRKAGGEPWGTSPEEAVKIIKEEFERYGKVIRDNKISLN